MSTSDNILRLYNRYSAFESKKFDTISIGEQKSVKELPPKDKLNSYLATEIKTGYRSVINNISESRMDLNSETVMKLVLIAISGIAVGVLLFVILEQFIIGNPFSGKPYSNVLAVSLGAYLLTIALSVPLLFFKRKIKISIKDNFLYLRSFPNLRKRFPLNDIIGYRLNVFNQQRLDYPEVLSLGSDSIKKSSTVDLDSGVMLFFKNGKCMVFGSSNSGELFRKNRFQPV